MELIIFILSQNAYAIPKVTLDFRILEPIYLRNYGDMLVSVIKFAKSALFKEIHLDG